jgi:hypothetical protein
MAKEEIKAQKSPREQGKKTSREKKHTHTPDLPELLRMDLQVIKGPSHSDNYLAAVAGGHTDVFALRLLPLTDEGFGLLRDQPHRC